MELKKKHDVLICLSKFIFDVETMVDVTMIPVALWQYE